MVSGQHARKHWTWSNHCGRPFGYFRHAALYVFVPLHNDVDAEAISDVFQSNTVTSGSGASSSTEGSVFLGRPWTRTLARILD